MEIEAKHIQPRLDSVSVRPTARDDLARALSHRLTIVGAPAGYGKTTTTAAVLEHCGRPAAWYKLDVLDHDPLTFLTAMIRAVHRLQPGFGSALLHELEASHTVDLPPLVVAAQFCSECDRRITTHTHLVLDDYHEVADATGLNKVLGYLLENCPDTIHFVVLTRFEPAFPFEKLQLEGQVARVRRDLLSFDAGQVADVLLRRSGRHHDQDFVARLLALTEGWPASVVLAGMALRWLDPVSLEDALADPRLRMDVFSYLAEQVFRRQPEEVQDFLLRTCCLEHVCVKLAERLTGSGSASRHLHFLAQNHAFTFEVGRKGTYRYHNLLRDYLRQRFLQERGEHAFRDLQLDTATALEDLDDRQQAVELLLAANELDAALETIAHGGEGELERRPSEQLRGWVTRLFPAIEARRPWALVVSGVLHTRENRFSRALAALHVAAEELDRVDDRDGLYQVLSITEWAEFWSGDCAASMQTCSRALDYASTEAQRLHTLLSLLSAAIDMRRWDAVTSAMSSVGDLLPGARPEEAARAQALRAHATFYQGAMRTAHDLIRRCHVRTQTAAGRAATLNTHGMIDLALADYRAATRHLREAATIAADAGHSWTSYMIEDSIAFLEAAEGGTTRALEALERLSSDQAQEPTLLAFTLCHCGTVLRRSQAIEASLEPTARAIAMIPADRDPYLVLNARANQAFAEGLLGGRREAALDQIAHQAESAGLLFVELKARLFAAILADAAGDPADAVHRLEYCLPRQLALGHINLVAQELCPRPQLTSRVVRRHRSNGLGPSVLKALSHHWAFSETAAVLRELGPSQVGTWIGHITSGSRAADTRRPHVQFTDRRGCGRASSGSRLDELTPRERDVLELMARDRSNEQIAADLFIAMSTVKTHINHILRKLGQKKRVGAVLEFQRLSRMLDDCPTRPRPPSSNQPEAGENPPWV